jgi:N-methylhydantoinase A
VIRALEMRYLGQNYELTLTIDAPAIDATTVPALWRGFHELHQARFGFHMPDSAIEVVNFMVTAIAVGPKARLPELAKASGAATPGGRRRVVFDGGAVDVPVHAREALRDGHRIAGPAVVEEAASVTILRPDQVLTVDRWGNLHLAHA